MSSPFIIWTLQRTGGTALFKFLKGISEHPAAEDEPFNEGRQFYSFYQAWQVSKRIYSDVDWNMIVGDGTLIKHCYDGFSLSFNKELLAASGFRPYKHIILLRRDSLARIISRFVAMQMATWFKNSHTEWSYNEVRAGNRKLDSIPVEEAIEYYRIGRTATKELFETFLQLRITPLHVDYEDLYIGDVSRRHLTVKFISEYLEIDRRPFPPNLEELMSGGINTGALYPHIPNFREIKLAIEIEEEQGYAC